MAALFVKAGGTNFNSATQTGGSVTVPTGGHAIGNTVAFYLGSPSAAATATISDTRGNTYTQFGTTRIWRSVLTTALLAGDTISWAGPSLVGWAAVSGEWSGVSTSTDGSNQASGTSTTPASGGITTVNATDLILGHVTVEGKLADGFVNDATTYDGSTWQAFAVVSNGNLTTSTQEHAAYLISTSAGAVDYKPAIGTHVWLDGVGALQASVVGGSIGYSII